MRTATCVTRVLVIEDNPDIREVLVEALRDEGYQVDWTSDGRRAVDKARQNTPALAIVDLMVPGMDGRRIIRECRTDPRCAATNFIVVSAFDVNQLEDVDAQAVIQKPFNLVHLMETVSELAPLEIA